MTHEIICAGFGGQGVMLIGQLIAYAGMVEGKNVSWVPSYGPEMRGGTANCSVVVSDEPVGSPVISEPNGVIAMNQPSLERFLPVVKPGGVLVYNSSLITMKETRDDLHIIAVPANELATELGNSKVSNLVALGAFLQKTNVVTADGIEKALEKVLPPHRHKLIPLNLEALRKGMALV
ncbi:MAG TPA: 2-oxoacid:ferredoxin oxidoreductase subunit gamma [Firmicutes bacterium]|nr:2-oxoacid:ferredoxin oxidoreductase subunit gamma [Bacillota bacterium]